ncbi:hypothetical protein J2W30_005879 [Variovorax boronicumulans]|uniref:hypothetical protein n=1 Tax=Variovorax TaxID=34072 RepID=UPI002785464E|nr:MULTISPECIES: hypothetical protein [Variovorax]MDQ0038092.1 hypothetical protein [Variovorax boronicumulans]MDQ0606245.1 hypothetical protein [Variovorax sp. W1I1]
MPKLMTLLRCLPLVIGLATTAGCTSVYRTPGAEAVAGSELAVLEYNGGLAIGVNIIEVDGKHRGAGFFRRYELTPGAHSITVALNLGLGFSAKSQLLTFEAKASEVYDLKYEIKNTGYNTGTWRVWIEEKATGRVISAMDGQART